MKIVLNFLVCASLVSCVTPADPQAMVPTSLALRQKFNKSVAVNVSGGQKTNPLWTSQVANEDFASALESAIRQNNVFSQVVRAPGGDYQLEVRLIQLRQPIVGLDMTVEANVEWRLKPTGAERVVWQQTISRAYTAKVGEAFAAAKRVQIANEGAIRANIKAGLEQISTLHL